jgi:hypothetical protein
MFVAATLLCLAGSLPDVILFLILLCPADWPMLQAAAPSSEAPKSPPGFIRTGRLRSGLERASTGDSPLGQAAS